MTKKRSLRIRPGLYTVYWKDGGSSLAAIGMLPNGDRWLAPINWVRPTEDQNTWRNVKAVATISPADIPTIAAIFD